MHSCVRMCVCVHMCVCVCVCGGVCLIRVSLGIPHCVVLIGSSLEARICKPYITHGCKLGSNCKFLYCTPEELANKMANHNDPPVINSPVRLGGGPGSHGPPRGTGEYVHPSPSRHQDNNSTEEVDTSNPPSTSN